MHRSGIIKSLNYKTLERAGKLKLDSVFLDIKEANENAINSVRKVLGKDIKIYVIAPVFKNQHLAEKHPDAIPVEVTGKDMPKSGWLCPTHHGIRKEILENIKEVLQYNIDGIWLDFIRYPTDWESPNPEIFDTCYCDRCLNLFRQYIGESIQGVGGEGSELENTALHIDGSYYHEWLEFKAGNITSFIEETQNLVVSEGKELKLGIFVVPWKDKDYGAGIQRIVAQDFSKLINVVDIFSPKLYYKSVGKDVDWVGNMVEYFWGIGKDFLPVVSVQDDGDNLSENELRLSIKNASARPSMGVCLHSLDVLKEIDLFD